MFSLTPLVLLICSLFSTFPSLKGLSPYFHYLDDCQYLFSTLTMLCRMTFIFCRHIFISHLSCPRTVVRSLYESSIPYTHNIISGFLVLIYTSKLLILCGDIELNPGPVRSKDLTISHWNLNGLAAQNFIKIPLLTTYLSIQDIDVMFISETLLDSSFANDDSSLNIQGYAFVRADHPGDYKRGGVCVYYEEHLPLKIRKDLSLLSECLVCEIKLDRKKSFLSSLYRSPTQSAEEFSEFKLNLEDMWNKIGNENPTISITFGDFNARCTNWWAGDIENHWGTEIDSLASLVGLTQLIDSPTHQLPNSSSCIDLIFFSQHSFIKDSGVHPSLFNTCHHQTTYVKLDFNVN